MFFLFLHKSVYMLWVLTVNVLKFRTLYSILFSLYFAFYAAVSQNIQWTGMAKSRPQSDCSFRSSPILVCTVCIFHFVRNFGVQNFSTFIVVGAPL